MLMKCYIVPHIGNIKRILEQTRGRSYRVIIEPILSKINTSISAQV